MKTLDPRLFVVEPSVPSGAAAGEEEETIAFPSADGRVTARLRVAQAELEA